MCPAPSISLASNVSTLSFASSPQALFKQLFRFVNVQLFNQLLLRRECCSFSNGEYVKTGLEQVAHWINGAGADYIADSWEELKYLRQVGGAGG